jgi:FdhE protein
VTSPAIAGDLARRRPECEPWLALVREAFRPDVEAAFDRVTADTPRPGEPGDRPLLADVAITLETRVLARYLDRLLSLASRTAGSPARWSLPEAAGLALLEAAIADDRVTIASLAATGGVPAEPLTTVASVAVMPVLQAYRRRWASLIPSAWTRPFCPMCGAWPGLAEARGLERTRRFRCLRCASDWQADWLQCPYCGNRDHRELGALASEATAETRRAETCSRCHGYVKTIATLQASAPADLVALDIETIELDIAAMERGYHRPAGLGYPLGVRVTPVRRGSPFRWRR